MELKVCERAILQLKGDVDHLFGVAKSMTNNLSYRDAAFKRKYKEIFDLMPDDIELIDNKIDEIKARIDCLMGNDVTQVRYLFSILIQFIILFFGVN